MHISSNTCSTCGQAAGLSLFWHAYVIISPRLQIWDVIHLLCLAAWTSKSQEGFWQCVSGFLLMCACVCVRVWGDILRDLLSHIQAVSSLVFSGLDLRARHLLILRDNCSWEPDCTRACVCVCMTHRNRVSLRCFVTYVCVPLCVNDVSLNWPVWPRPAPSLTLVQCYAVGGKSLSLPWSNGNQKRISGSNFVNIKAFTSGPDSTDIYFCGTSDFWALSNYLHLKEEKTEMRINGDSTEQFALNA